MFYSYVIKTPFVVKEKQKLLEGAILEVGDGYIRHTIDDDFNSIFTIRNRGLDVSYRATSTTLAVTRGSAGRRPNQQILIVIPQERSGQLVLSDFRDQDEREDVENFLCTLSEMQKDYDRREGIMKKLEIWIKDPVAKIILFAGVVYAMVTVFVLFAG